MNQSIREKMSGFHPTAIAATKFATAGFIALDLLIFLIAFLGEFSSRDLGGNAGQTFLMFMLYFVCILSFAGVLVAFNIKWGVLFLRSRSQSSDNLSFVSTSAASMLGSFLWAASYFSGSLYFIIMLSNNHLDDELSVLYSLGIIVDFLGAISLIITSIARKKFYTSIYRATSNENSAMPNGVFYGVMKFVNIGFRFTAIIFILIYMDKMKYMFGESLSGLVVILLIIAIFAVMCSMAECVFEALFAFRFKPYAPTPQFAAPYAVNTNDYANTPTTYNQPVASATAQSAVQTQSFCTKCGAKLQDGFDFCNQCGAKIK